MQYAINLPGMVTNKYYMLVKEDNSILCWSYGNSTLNKIEETDQILEITKEQYNILMSQEYWKYQYIDGVISGVEGTER